MCRSDAERARRTESMREIQAMFAAAGVPPRARQRPPVPPGRSAHFAAIRFNYPKITADAGPCGLWPEDLGPSFRNQSYYDNRPYYNFGCASQRNLAAMIDNPADLVQPRPETPAYTTRRTTAFEKYRKGDPTATNYPEAERPRSAI